MWERYVKKRREIRMRRCSELPIRPFDPPVKTQTVIDQNSDCFETLESDVNEVYLMHGTQVRSALKIATEDFSIDLAGTGAGTMYGRGCYLAESCTKADEYAQDETGGYYENIFALLIIRACMGKVYYTTDRNEKAGEKVKAGTYDGTLGDRLKIAGTFREFVVYDADQVYPEYIVIYKRVGKGEDLELINRKLALVEFHMQLPCYWTNCYQNPEKDIFHMHITVAQPTKELLQKLAQASLAEDKPVTVLSARRIEHSEIWNRYVKFKQMLRARLRQQVKGDVAEGKERVGFTPVHELDGDPSRGHVLTQVNLKDDLEQAISVDNIEEMLNEHMLWHGTSKEAAEKITTSDFYIPTEKDVGSMKHGKRFGTGAYFAESLTKSLSYAPKSHGVQHVLLCRVLCGDIYYTEKAAENDADVKALLANKDSILANPTRLYKMPSPEPREFIILRADAVYPEYVLEVKVGS